MKKRKNVRPRKPRSASLGWCMDVAVDRKGHLFLHGAHVTPGEAERLIGYLERFIAWAEAKEAL